MYDPVVSAYKIKSRPAVVREASPVYGEPEAHQPAPVFQLTVGERGRLVLPAEVRQRLNINVGDRLSLVVAQDGTITIQTGAVYARSLRGMFKHLARPGQSVVDELIAERRREVAIEDRKDREFMARHGLKRRR